MYLFVGANMPGTVLPILKQVSKLYSSLPLKNNKTGHPSS
ncbi:hypothetical protein MC7420_1136 [Coleofasciculus chthonoplastes PCC 7420]|uniref:Uncharacterized protein n=1 Tax=Coleofasciculus chthonoplastes PCC 7420 TaxID=118168 RepID=B4VXS5_9CYAN|nr:hypothetical protein MC7420_1136 [Coleofasciculus chthonoplastes PCC 7420]